MSTKTTDDVRRAYEDCHKDEHELNYGEYSNQRGKFQRVRDEFDAWLAAHDAEVAAVALESESRATYDVTIVQQSGAREVIQRPQHSAQTRERLIAAAESLRTRQ